jgi:hypothetical protein
MTPAACGTTAGAGGMRLLAAGEHDRWDDFVASSPHGTIFHTAWWHRAWGIAPIVHARTGARGRIEAGFPLSPIRVDGVPAAIAPPPLSPVAGPVFLLPEGESRGVRNARIRREMERALACVPDVAFCALTLGCGITDAVPFLLNGFAARPLITYVIPAADRDGWEANVHPRHLRKLAAARRDACAGGLTVDDAPPLSEVLPLLEETARHGGFALTPGIPRWWRAVRDRDAGRAYVLRGPGAEPLCAAVMVWDHRSAYYLLGGMRDAARRTNLNYLLVERMIRDALARGVDFDFEGSLLPGVEAFFRLWGGEQRVLLRLVRARQ